ncbi:hypothetical protein BY996DRAFT_6475601 [Phakopsora pachyrhizi]|nr:hypothetical protein BY996DRAFT_6475601 [Phakopsora pachyrhizi]
MMIIVEGILTRFKTRCDLHVCCWEHQEVGVEVVKTIHNKVEMTRVLEVNWVFFKACWSRWHRNIFRLPASVNTGEPPRSTYCIISSTRSSGRDTGVGGSEYGGNEGVVESAAALGSTTDPVPSLALGRAAVIAGHSVSLKIQREKKARRPEENVAFKATKQLLASLKMSMVEGYHKEGFTGPAEARPRLGTTNRNGGTQQSLNGEHIVPMEKAKTRLQGAPTKFVVLKGLAGESKDSMEEGGRDRRKKKDKIN